METFLLRLSRASGVDGLVGMAAAASLIAADPTAARGSGSVPSGVPPETSAAAAPGTDAGGSPKILAFTVRVLRPLLGVQRSQLRALLARCRVAWVEDPTNADTSYSRNAIRALLTQPQRQQQLQRHQQQPAANLVSNQPSGMQLDTSAASQPADAHDSGSRQAAADMAALPAAAEGAATVTYDLLRLQRRCAAAVAEMQGAAAALLAECAPEHLQQARVPGTIVITLPPLAMALLPVVVRMLSAVLWVSASCMRASTVAFGHFVQYDFKSAMQIAQSIRWAEIDVFSFGHRRCRGSQWPHSRARFSALPGWSAGAGCICGSTIAAAARCTLWQAARDSSSALRRTSSSKVLQRIWVKVDIRG